MAPFVIPALLVAISITASAQAPKPPGKCRPSVGRCNFLGRPPAFRTPVMVAQAQAALFVVDGKVLCPAAYAAEVARLLRVGGYCATALPDGGVQIKPQYNNTASEIFELVSTDGDVQNRAVSVCLPANF